MYEVDVPVEFQGVSIGADTARLGCKIDRDQLPLMQADDTFRRFRLTGRVILGGFTDSPGQTRLNTETEPTFIAAEFDVKGYRVTDKAYSIGLTFAKDAIDYETLAGFAKEKGRFLIESIAEIPADEKDDDEEGSDWTAGALFSSQAEWQRVQLDTLFEGRVLKAMKSAGLDTLGGFTEYQKAKGDFWAKDLKGVGAAAREDIENRLIAFWRDNPQYTEGAAT